MKSCEEVPVKNTDECPLSKFNRNSFPTEGELSSEFTFFADFSNTLSLENPQTWQVQPRVPKESSGRLGKSTRNGEGGP